MVEIGFFLWFSLLHLRFLSFFVLPVVIIPSLSLLYDSDLLLWNSCSVLVTTYVCV